MSTEKIPIRIVPDALYWFKGVECTPEQKRNLRKKWWAPPGYYRCLAEARDVHTLQLKVVYCGVGGPDDGKVFVTTLADWQQKFTLIEDVEEQPVYDIPEEEPNNDPQKQG